MQSREGLCEVRSPGLLMDYAIGCPTKRPKSTWSKVEFGAFTFMHFKSVSQIVHTHAHMSSLQVFIQSLSLLIIEILCVLFLSRWCQGRNVSSTKMRRFYHQHEPTAITLACNFCGRGTTNLSHGLQALWNFIFISLQWEAENVLICLKIYLFWR
jgi:hypothetical protein